MPTYTAALSRMRSFVRPSAYIKIAEHGPSNEGAFEQAFASLGHSYMAEKAPRLLQYELGFQLLEKNEDGTRAVGIFAFKVGEHYLYCPVFFLNGELKGHELLYIKNQDLFVPLEDTWVSYLLGRKPLALGGGTERNLSRLGVQGPNFYQLSRSPQKWASVSDGDGWRDDAVRAAAYFAVTSPEEGYGGERLTLADFVKNAGVATYRTLLRFCRAKPTLAAHVDAYHPGLLEDGAACYRPTTEKKASLLMSKEAMRPGTWDASNTPESHLARVKIDKGQRFGMDAMDGVATGEYRSGRKQREARKQSLLEMMRDGQKKQAAAKPAADRTLAVTMDQAGGPEVRDLSKDEKNKLLAQRYVVRDTRVEGEFAHAYDATGELKLQNPTETGIYQVLVRPFDFRNCLVFCNP